MPDPCSQPCCQGKALGERSHDGSCATARDQSTGNLHADLARQLGMPVSCRKNELLATIERRMEAWQTEAASNAAQLAAVAARIDEYRADDMLTTEEVHYLKTGGSL